MHDKVDSGSLADLLENARDPILITIGDVPVFANAPVFALTGYDRGEILERNFERLVHPDEREKLRRFRRESAGDDQPRGVFTLLVCRDGSLRPVELTALRTTWREQEAAFLILRDTSHRAEEVAHLREVEQNLRFLIENTNDVIVVASSEGRYVYANRPACRLTGYSLDELLATPYVQLVHPEEVAKVRERFRNRLSGRPAPRRYETRIVRKDGGVIPIELTAAAVTWKGDLADVIIIRDLSDRKRDEALLAKQQRLNERLRREMEERQRAEQTLRRRDAVLEAVSFSAERFLTTEHWDESIQVVLERLGGAAEVERAALYQRHAAPDGSMRVSRRYSWDGAGATTADPSEYQDIPLDSVFPQSWRDAVERGQPVLMSAEIGGPHVGALLRRLGTESALALPIMIHGSLWGMLTLSNPRAGVAWQQPEIDALGLAGNLLGTAMERRESEEAVRRKDRILEAVAFASERFLQARRWDEGIEDVLGRLARAAQVSRAAVYRNEGGSHVGNATQIYRWADPESPYPSDPSLFRSMDPGAFFTPEMVARLERGQPVQFSAAGTAPQMRQALERVGAFSVLVFPVLVGNRLWGALGLSHSRPVDVIWQPVEIDALQAAGNVLGAVIQRAVVAESLRRKDEILEGVSSAVERLMKAARWEDIIGEVLECLGRASGSSRLVLSEVRPAEGGEHILHWLGGWASPEWPFPVKVAERESIPIIASGYGEVLEQLRRGVPQILPPHGSAPDKIEVVRRHGTVSVLSVPVMVQGRLWGVLGFSDCVGVRDWSAPEIDALRASGDILGVVLERQQVEGALRESEDKYRTLVEGADQVIAVIDRRGVFRFANARALAYLGLRSEEIVGKSMWDIFPQEHADRQAGEVVRTLDAGQIRVRQERTIVRGDSRWFETRLLPIRDRHGRFETVQIISTDITDRKEAEERILSYQERLRSLSSELALIEQRERRRIAAQLHDRIGQSLALTKIKLSQLRDTAPDPGVRRALGELWSLLDQTIADTRSLTFELSPPILSELGLEPALDWLVERTRSRHGLKAEFQDDGSTKPLGPDLRDLVFHGVQELITNVVKHAAAGHVVVSIRRDGDRAVCEVRDDGRGFDASAVAGASPGHPLGFGLFSIRERIGHLGGKCEIESFPGSGTRVTLYVPLLPEEPGS